MCLNPYHPKRQVKSRGLCGACYNAACRLVRRRQTTWEKSESQGKAIPNCYPNRYMADAICVNWLLSNGADNEQQEKERKSEKTRIGNAVSDILLGRW